VGDDVIVSEADKPFVETVRIQNFGCGRDVTLELTRLHALIGPNDARGVGIGGTAAGRARFCST
jgi:hypothetical protein